VFDIYFSWTCSGEEAYLKIRAGATLVQLYTAFAYEGPSMLPRVKVCLLLGWEEYRHYFFLRKHQLHNALQLYQFSNRFYKPSSLPHITQLCWWPFCIFLLSDNDADIEIQMGCENG
jgi:hypothetical protein